MRINCRCEFMNDSLLKWLYLKGMEVHITAPHLPSQNGVTKWMNRTLNVTAIPGAALGTVVERASEGDVHKACIAAVRASVSPWPQWLLSGMHWAFKADGYCLVTQTASYCCTDDSDLSIVKTMVIVSVATIVMPLTRPPYCLTLNTALTLRVVLSRCWGHPVDPSLILLSVLIQGCIALSNHRVWYSLPLVLVTSSKSSST